MKVITAIIAVFIVIVVVAILFWTSTHWWREVGSAEVSHNGKALRNANIYRGQNDDILIRLNQAPDENSAYIFYRSENLIGIPNANQFIYLPMYAFSIDVPPPVVISNDRVKMETNMNVVVSDNVIEFTTLNGGRVKITLTKP